MTCDSPSLQPPVEPLALCFASCAYVRLQVLLAHGMGCSCDAMRQKRHTGSYWLALALDGLARPLLTLQRAMAMAFLP